MERKYLDQNGLERVNGIVDEKIADRVPIERTINSKPLSGDVMLTVDDIGGITVTQMNTAIKTAIKDTWDAAY